MVDVTVGTVVNVNVHSMVLFYLNTAARKYKCKLIDDVYALNIF